MVETLRLEEVLDIREALLAEFSDMQPGVDKPEALRAAVAMQTRRKFYEGGDLAERAAVLGAGILLRQVFVDGNHRTAWVAMDTLLRRNKATIHATPDEWLDFLHEYYDTSDSTHRPKGLSAWLRRRLQRL